MSLHEYEIEELIEKLFKEYAFERTECVGFDGSKPHYETFVELPPAIEEAIELLEAAKEYLRERNESDARRFLRDACLILEEENFSLPPKFKDIAENSNSSPSP